MKRKWLIVYRFQPNNLKHPLTQTIVFQIAEVGFVVKIYIFGPGQKFLGQFEHSLPVCLESLEDRAD